MNREFLLNIILVIGLNLAVKTVYIFGIERTVQNRVGEGDYGIYFTILSFTFIFQIVTDLGVNSFNNRHIAQHRQLLDKYFSGLLILKGLLALAFFLVIVMLGWLAGYLVEYPFFVLGLGLVQVLSSVVAFLRSNISGLGLYRTDSVVSVLDRLLLIFICGLLLFHPICRPGFKIEWFVQAQIFTLSITAMICFAILRKHLGQLQFRLNPAFIMLLLQKSAPFALAIFLMTIYSRLDSIMIDQLLADGVIQADYYASAFRLFQASNMVGMLFAGLLLPMFSRQIKEKEAFFPLLRLSFKMIMSGVLPLGVVTVFYRQQIMEWMYNSGSLYTGNILGFLMVGFIAVSGAYVYSALLTANDNLRQMNQVFIAGVFLNVILNLVFVPSHKALGAAAATCLTQYFVFFGLVFQAYRLLQLQMMGKLVFQIFAVVLVVAGSTYLLRGVNILDWQMKFLLSLFWGLLITVIFGLIDKDSLVELMRSGKS